VYVDLSISYVVSRGYVCKTIKLYSMNPSMLMVTSLCFCIPLLLFLFKKNPPLEEIILGVLLSINLVLSLLFWSKPIQHSVQHVYDAMFAKISCLLFTVYILFKPMTILLKVLVSAILLVGSTLFLIGHRYSQQQWCGSNHLRYHSMFHLCSSAGCCFAFI